jgi:outer membrane murein-binding lipoprotein Lpp
VDAGFETDFMGLGGLAACAGGGTGRVAADVAGRNAEMAKKTEASSAVAEMEAAVKSLEQQADKLNADHGPYDRIRSDIKGAKSFGPGDAKKLAELEARAKAAYTRISDFRKASGPFCAHAYRTSRGVHQAIGERRRLAEEGAASKAE